jgi:hypothetical protein
MPPSVPHIPSPHTRPMVTKVLSSSHMASPPLTHDFPHSSPMPSPSSSLAMVPPAPTFPFHYSRRTEVVAECTNMPSTSSASSSSS